MATKKDAIAEEKNLVIFDQMFSTSKGDIRIVVDGSTIQQDITEYYDHLLFARGIPLDRENISPKDPLVMIAHENLSYIKDKNLRVKKAIEMVSRHYALIAEEAYRESVFLALAASPENIFDFVPQPYDDVSPIRRLPGMSETLPKPKKDLTVPLEIRLKQILDMIATNASILDAFTEAFTVSAIIFNQEVEKDKAGFHSTAAN